MGYFEIEFDPELSRNEMETIKTSVVEADNFFDKEFERLETSTEGFRKDDVQKMNVFFWKLDEEETKLTEFEPDTLMKTVTLEEDVPPVFKRGDSIIHMPFGKEVDRDTVVHELAHVVYTSFSEERGINKKFKPHFKRLEENLTRRPKDPEALRRLLDSGEPISDEDYFCELVAVYSSRSDVKG